MNETEREVRIEAEDANRIVDMSETETGAAVEIVEIANGMDMETDMATVITIGTRTGTIGTTIGTTGTTTDTERGTIVETGMRAETGTTTEMIVETGTEEEVVLVLVLEVDGAESPIRVFLYIYV